MQYGICNLSLIPIRQSAGHTSEMVSQLLFGETFDILGREESWILIQTRKDHYTGWIHYRQYLGLETTDMDEWNATFKVLVNGINSSVTEKTSGNHLHLLMGSSIPLPYENQFHFAGENYSFNGDYFEAFAGKDKIIHFARMYLGAPYLWGGRSHFGIDCSGLTQMAYHLSGYSLPRDASQQALEGESLSFLSEAVPGDLLFFDNDQGQITHVGLLNTENTILHSSGNVRIDTIDHQGIFNENLKKYTHKLRLVKRVVEG